MKFAISGGVTEIDDENTAAPPAEPGHSPLPAGKETA